MHRTLGERLCDLFVLLIMVAELAGGIWFGWRQFSSHAGVAAGLWVAGTVIALPLIMVLTGLLYVLIDPNGTAGLEGGCLGDYEDFDEPLSAEALSSEEAAPGGPANPSA